MGLRRVCERGEELGVLGGERGTRLREPWDGGTRLREPCHVGVKGAGDESRSEESLSQTSRFVRFRCARLAGAASMLLLLVA